MDTALNEIDDCLNDYIREFGMRKFEKVKGKVYNSKTMNKNHGFIYSNPNPIRANTFVLLAGNIYYFAFGKKEHLAIAAILFLREWHIHSNSQYLIYNDIKIIEIIQDILQRTKGLLY